MIVSNYDSVHVFIQEKISHTLCINGVAKCCQEVSSICSYYTHTSEIIHVALCCVVYKPSLIQII